MTALILAALIVAAPLHASGDGTTTPDARWQSAADYSPNVQRARRWLRRQMPRRQFRCLYHLWAAESGWRVHAGTPSKAYGIPQAYPGYRMRSAGRDWRTNALTQVRWGFGHYIGHRYDGRPCKALRFQDRHGWY